MNIDDLTIGEAKKLAGLFSNNENIQSNGLNSMIGEKVIIRTYSAGNWFGILDQKSGTEVILKDARRMWRWHCKKSISLSGVALYGINQSKSRIAPSLDSVWLDAIEIIPCSEEAIKLIDGADDATAD